MDGDLCERQYREHLSVYKHWDQLSHAADCILFEKNMDSYLGIDKVTPSQGKLYIILINKAGKGRKGTIITIIKGTEVKKVCDVLLKMSHKRRFQACEITLDMTPNIEIIARTCFPVPKRITDQFYVQQLVSEAV